MMSFVPCVGYLLVDVLQAARPSSEPQTALLGLQLVTWVAMKFDIGRGISQHVPLTFE